MSSPGSERQARTAAVLRAEEAQPMRTAHPGHWIGELHLHPVGRALGTSELELNALFLEEGTRKKPHLHSADQVIYCVSGAGVVALDGGADQRIEEGQFVVLPASVP